MMTSTFSYHPWLLKQIETLDETHLDDPSFVCFLEKIHRAYIRLEKDKQLSEHAFEISEKEYVIAYKDLQREADLRKESIQKLNDAICLFDDKVNFNLDKEEDDIFAIISYLERHIQKSKVLEARLRKAKEDAESAAIAKGDFLSVMSHEIRTPLNAINGIIYLLLSDNPAPDQIENLKALELSSENLLSLINDILDFSKIENGKILFSQRPFELRPFIQNIKQVYNHCAQDKGNTIDVTIADELPETIKGDDLRLRQILNNLVSNAIKFTKDGTIKIDISVAADTATEISVRFSIKDSGIGIQKEKQQHIFERFAQADASTTRKYGGTGLGLAITKKLLELQGSTIFLDSDADKGSEFYFVMAFAKGLPKAQTDIETRMYKDLRGANILLVDDNAMNILFTKKLIHQWNTAVDTAVNGVEAIERAKSKKYDLILMDLHMPIMDGYTASQEIRSFDQLIPIIALTASIDNDIQEKIKQNGLNDFLQKPFKPNELYEMIYRNVA
jgi:signal transduction histidine kinase/CheY-like chemotaxis protein